MGSRNPNVKSVNVWPAILACYADYDYDGGDINIRVLVGDDYFDRGGNLGSFVGW